MLVEVVVLNVIVLWKDWGERVSYYMFSVAKHVVNILGVDKKIAES